MFASSSSSSVQPPEGAAAAGASKLSEEGAGLAWEGVSDGVQQKGKPYSHLTDSKSFSYMLMSFLS